MLRRVRVATDDRSRATCGDVDATVGNERRDVGGGDVENARRSRDDSRCGVDEDKDEDEDEEVG